MKPKLTDICSKSKKISYSESAASRAVNSVDGARRYYRCTFCDKFHITSMGIGLMNTLGLDYDDRGSSRKYISNKKIRKNMKKLIVKIFGNNKLNN